MGSDSLNCFLVMLSFFHQNEILFLIKMLKMSFRLRILLLEKLSYRHTWMSIMHLPYRANICRYYFSDKLGDIFDTKRFCLQGLVANIYLKNSKNQASDTHRRRLLKTDPYCL